MFEKIFIKATVVYWLSNVINRLRKNKPGYKPKPRGTHQVQQENKGTILCLFYNLDEYSYNSRKWCNNPYLLILCHDIVISEKTS